MIDRTSRLVPLRQTILKAATHSIKVSVQDWDKALSTLVQAGELRVDVGPHGKKTVILLKEAD